MENSINYRAYYSSLFREDTQVIVKVAIIVIVTAIVVILGTIDQKIQLMYFI